MGIWSWLNRLVKGETPGLALQRHPSLPAHPPPAWLDGDGNFNLEIVGESHHQRAFEEICGPRTEKGENRFVTATLILDNTNRYDNNAVRVEVEGKTVGYLSRSAASTFRTRLQNERVTAPNFTCKANIRGGWSRENQKSSMFSIYLDVCLYD
jgi:HIRAN domain-containing protein